MAEASSLGFVLHAALLEGFLKDAIPGLGGAIVIEPVAGGQSNPTYFVTFGDRRLVLRRRPPGNLLPSAHAIDREYRVLTALRDSAVPVPETLLFHAGAEVIGSAFYVMERLDGRIFHDNALPGLRPAERGAIYASMGRRAGAAACDRLAHRRPRRIR